VAVLRRVSLLMVVYLVAGTSLGLVDSGPAGARSWGGPCPNMTDSITRLYSAFFLREPDQQGFDYWVGVYRNTSDGLAEMAENFVRSTEFENRYGALDNRQFVDLVYRNVMRRAPDPEGFDHWVNALDRGFPRGAVMISFSESQEYVEKTATAAPAAGYLQWFQGDVRWDCGPGWLWVSVNGRRIVDDRAPNIPPPPAHLTFGNGTRAVGGGTPIPAGTYRTRAKATNTCYWERLTGFGGTLDEIIANDLGNGYRIVTIGAGDRGFSSSRCPTWSSDLSAVTNSPTAPFGEGVYIVGVDIAAGTWTASGTNCYWARRSGFGGNVSEIIANNFSSGPQVVTIRSTDRGFETSHRCGTWTRVG
jgi:hypothetical protein